MKHYIAIFACVLIVVLAKKDEEANCENQKFKGCTVRAGKCICDKVAGTCYNPWPFRDQVECEKELHGENDKCLIKEPCVHGQCVQVNLGGKRKWQCACAGTGFFGRKCEEPCPPSDQSPLPEDYPAACIY